MRQEKKLEWGLRVNYYLVKHLWPLIRLSVKHKLSKRCSICTLNDKFVVIEDGVCEICRGEKTETGPAQPRERPAWQEEGEKRLDDIFRKAQNKGAGQYDALLYFSGGKDSTYMLHKLMTNYQDLRILAFTVDNGYRSPIGKQNAEKVCQHFNVDHMEIRPYRVFTKLYKYGFENFSDKSFYCVDYWEGELFQDVGRNLAVKLGIPLLVVGYTPDQIEAIPEEFDNDNLYPLDEYIFRGNQNFKRETFMGHSLAEIYDEQEMTNWWDGTKIPEEDLPTVVFPFGLWGYDKNAIQQTVSGLNIVGEGDMDPMLTNDIYCTLGLYFDYRIFGYCSVEPEWAKLVRSGREDRVQNRNLWEAVEYISLYHENFLLKSPEIKTLLDKFEMSLEKVKEIQSLSPGIAHLKSGRQKT